MADRYFLETPPKDGRAVVSGPEAHHLMHVMRARPGDEIVLFDGSGAEFAARVEKTGRSEVQCVVLSRSEIDREAAGQMVVAVALPKGDRQRWLVEKLVELGVSELAPLETERGVAQPVDNALARLRRSVIEASKQCGRNRLMAIAAPRPWRDFATSAAGDSIRLVAHPGGTPCGQVLDRLRASEPHRHVQFAVGPEGGFTDAEVNLALQAGWQAVDLGKRILRVETAAVFLAALAVLAAE